MFHFLEVKLPAPHLKWNSCWIFVFFPSLLSFNLDTKFPLFYNGSLNDCFGFSVGLIRNKHGYQALITAPRANSSLFTNLHQPGVLFRCNISPSGDSPSCSEVTLETKGNMHGSNENYNLNYEEKQDDMWLGVSLDIQKESEGNKAVVCGHLWKNRYFPNGVCYMMSTGADTAEVEKLVPFANKRKQTVPSGKDHKGYYGYAQAGTSAAFSLDGKSLLLGSPGFYEWRGTVASYSMNRTTGLHSRVPILPGAPIHQTTSSSDYIGYSVTTGKFFDEVTTYIAAGAPRGENKKGVVYIFEPLEKNINKLVVYQKKEGVQFGGYFGASVSGIDLNNDGLTDLLVGAPLYSEESGGDEGRVYVYISNGMGLQNVAELSGRNKKNSRFGTCIGDIGDLNLDGFNDVAIGAPYEDGHGAVYIYHGTGKGLNGLYVQRIGAAEINPMLSGFGISISRGLDVDDNTYLDVLIGSYASSKAVLFRTYPIIEVKAQIEFNPPKINRSYSACKYREQNLSCFNVTYCLRYKGKHVPRSLEFGTELHMDYRNANSRRGFILSNGMELSAVSRKVNLEAGPNAPCFQETAYVFDRIRDEVTPIEFFLSYAVNFSAKPDYEDSKFCKDCPILDSSPNITKSIPFEIECGHDDICIADLFVEAHVLENQEEATLIIGQNDTLTLTVILSNRGETAYAAMLFIHFPPEVFIVKQDLCSIETDGHEQDDSNITLACEFGNFLKKDKSVNLLIKIDVKRIPVTTKSLNVHFEASTVSKEANATDNEFNLPIFFKSMADIGVSGYQEGEQIPYTEEKKIETVTHRYYVMNYGPSPVEQININLYIPTAIHGKKGWLDFLVFTNIEVSCEKLTSIPAKCDTSSIKLNKDLPRPRRSISKKHDAFGPEIPPSDICGSGNTHGVTERSTVERKGRRDPTLNCETAKCVMISCVAGPFPVMQFTRISVSVEISFEVLIRAMGTWRSIEFITEGNISMNGTEVLPDNQPNEYLVKTTILRPGPPVPEKVANWIIFVSIAIGLVLFLIILAALIKIGFFKRQQREEMGKMMFKAELKDVHPDVDRDVEETADRTRLYDSRANRYGT